MKNGLSGWTKDKRFSGIHIHGPKKDEFLSIADSLLNGILPKGWEWVNSSSNTIVARRLAPSTYYKEYLNRSPIEALKNLFRGSRCKRARVKREILIQKGFNSPAIYCWGRKGQRHFMVTKGVDALGLGRYISQNWHPPLSKEKVFAKRIIIEKLGGKIGRLHKLGIYHGDLRLNNILIQQKDRDIEFHIIDNESICFYKKIPKRLIEKNLVQVNMVFPLYMTREDRIRFFKVYTSVYHRFTGNEKNRLFERIQKRTQERLAKCLPRIKRR